MTPRWKALVEVTLREKGWKRATLAQKLGISRAAVTKLLDEQDVSSLVPAICEVLSIPPPMVEAQSSEVEAAIASRVASWSDEQREKMLQLLDVIEKMIS